VYVFKKRNQKERRGREGKKKERYQGTHSPQVLHSRLWWGEREEKK